MSFRIIVGILALLAATLGATNCASKPLLKFEETRSMMDTFITVTVYSDEKKANEAISAAFNRMEQIEKEASIFDESSEAFKLNRDGYLEGPSVDLWKLITISLQYSQITDGYFDVTVQPILELWQGGLWKEIEEVQRIKINETLSLVGSDKVDTEDNKIFFKEEGMRITLGGIAKGYAADEALRVISGVGLKHALVNIGGDIAALGSKPKDEPWTITLVNPDNTSQSLANFRISDKAVATSGSYERYFDPNRKSHHIINPKTGYSANECISVTIIAEDGTQADALATGVYVMGPKEGMKLVESLDGVECLIVDAARIIHRSSGMSVYLGESP